MKVTRAIGKGFFTTHKGWPVSIVLFIFYSIIRSIVSPSEDIEPALRSAGNWGIILAVVAVSLLGLNYLWGGVQAFARDGINENLYRFKGFFRNCNKYFIRQICLSFLIGIPLWFLSIIFVGLLGGALSIADRNLLASLVLGAAAVIFFCLIVALGILLSFSWTIAVADNEKIFRAVFKSVLFAGKRFFKITGLFLLLFAISIVVSLMAWICYAFFIQGLRRLGFDGVIVYIREIVGCALYAYFLLLTASSFMAYYLNNNKAPHKASVII